MKRFVYVLAIAAGIGFIIGFILLSKKVDVPIEIDDLDSDLSISDADAADSEEAVESKDDESKPSRDASFTPGWRGNLH